MLTINELSKKLHTYPALFLGCFLLLSAASALFPHWAYCFGIVTLAALFVSARAWKLGLCFLCLSGLFYGYLALKTPNIHLPKPVQGKGVFAIDNLKIVHSPFNSSYLYKGILSFETRDGKKLPKIPCAIFLAIEKERINADRAYLIEGTLQQKDRYSFRLKPTKNLLWKEIDKTFSWAEWRFQAKEKVRLWIHKIIKNTRVATFFTALLTGDIDDRLLALEFSRIGLQHILCISGFHFALFAAFCGLVLRLFLPLRGTACALFFLMSFYFFFVGDAPSVMRAWISISMYLLGRILKLHCPALNALGIALAIEVLYNPLCVSSVGFQLSFLCTWAILALYPLTSFWLKRAFPQRTLKDVLQMHSVEQHGYLFSAFIREALAVNAAVHLASFFVILFLFHKFPLHSVIYNLFFPFFFSLSMLVFLCGVVLVPFQALIHKLNTLFTSALLETAAHPLPILEYYLRIKSFPFPLLMVILSLIFLAGTLTKTETIEYK